MRTALILVLTELTMYYITDDKNIYKPSKDKGKSVPLQSRRGPEGSRKLRFPDYVKTAQDDGKVVSLMHRPPLPPGNTPGIHFF